MLGTLLRRSQLGQTLPRATAYRFVACWKCGSELDTTSDYFCNISKCGAVQSYKLTDVNAFQLLGMEQKYSIDMSTLDVQYKNAQKLLHPDKFSAKDIMERNASAETSSTVNQAYQVCIWLIDHDKHQWIFLTAGFAPFYYLDIEIANQ